MTEAEALIGRLNGAKRKVDVLIATGLLVGASKTTLQHLADVARDAASALQQAISERNEARLGLEIKDRMAASAEAQVQRLTASLADETEACARLLELPMGEILLHMGELTAQEKRSLKDFIAWRASAIRRRKHERP